MTRIFLIRHAEAEGNIFRRAHGHFNGQIIGRGFEQIDRLKARFEHEKFDAVYSSDLSRTRVTASAIYVPHNLPLNTTSRLREVNMGEWEDKAWGDIEHDDPEMNRNFSMDPERWHVSGSEGFHHTQTRIRDCVLEIAGQHDSGTVAVISHGFAIRSFISGLLGIRSDEIKKVTYFDNTAVTLLLCENGELSISYQGDNSHLSSESSTFANQTWWRSKNERVTENSRFLQLDETRDLALLEQIREETGKKHGAGEQYVAFLGDEPAGVIGLDTASYTTDGMVGQGGWQDGGISSAEAGNIGWIDYIYVRPELRRRNYGIQLIGQAVSVFRKLKCEKTRVIVSHDNPAIGFFERFDFTKIGDSDSGYIMEKNIRNWE
ncbi:MAG: bifunctional histidine phosphatase family protein/GNAT family N-acetyltransferase [Oscillospiraceae bacterium]|nr:bifunctional histidine phosphatase family protein/GNAT family N-acetyltransferase [Oscillospiraceae bacterium]